MTTGPGPLERFEVTVGFVDDQPVVGVRGEVDLVTAPVLGALVDALIGGGHRSLVVDLGGVDFMSASGLNVIAAGAGHLGRIGGGLALRSPSAVVSRMLAVTGLSEVVRVESPDPDPGPLPAERSTAAPGFPVRVGVAALAGPIRRVTAIPASADVVDGALRLVVALAQVTVDGADGVSVSLHRHGRLTTVAATDQTISEMDADQYATGEGPCVDASVEGRRFYAESLADESRWPAFTPKARGLGINAILSTPLMAHDRPIGALNIYSGRSAAFATREQELASIFATEASSILRDAGADVADEALAGRLGEALAAREVIAQAQGVVMAREGVSADDAFTTLRRLSGRSERSLRDVATDVVDATRRPPPGHGDHSPVEAPSHG